MGGEDFGNPAARFGALLARRLTPEDAWTELEALLALDPKRRRGYQAHLLAQTFRDAAELAARLGWPGKVVISDGRVMVDQDGALLSADAEIRYFRSNAAPAGAYVLERLKGFGVEPKTILDVGANIGELSIYCARRLPSARVIAFEPAPENLAEFRANLALQDPPLTNLELVAEAVSDRAGTIPFTVGAGDLNTTMVEANLKRLEAARDVSIVEVPTDTLDSFCARLDVEVIDLLKVDTEGGEPRLASAIRAMRGRIRAAYVEISIYNTLEAYADLVAAFAEIGMPMFEKRGQPVARPMDWLAKHLKGSPAINVWFAETGALDEAPPAI